MSQTLDLRSRGGTPVRGGATPLKSQSRAQTAGVHHSNSSPSLGNAFSSTGAGFRDATNFRTGKKIPNRGAHDVGAVIGHNHQDEIYVPRAMWTQSIGSPFSKNPEFDVREVFHDEMKRQQHQEMMKSYYQKELGRQMKEVMSKTMNNDAEKEELNRAIEADAERFKRETQTKWENAMKTRQALRDGLGQQVAELERRAKNSRLQDLHDGAEIKARTMQQLAAEMAAQQKRKKNMKADADQMRREVAALKKNNSDSRLQEAEELREYIRTQNLQDEYRLAAQQERLRAAQANTDKNEENYNKTAGKDLNAKLKAEVERQERDAKKNDIRAELHYGRREAARERQRQNMCQTLKVQVASDHHRKELARMADDKEKAAIDAGVRNSMEQELANRRQKRQEELANQHQLVTQMAHKQEQLRKEENRPNIATNTMHVSPEFMAMSLARAKSAGSLPQTGALMHQLDASRNLEKPCGRPVEVKPWVNIALDHGVGGVVGVFGGQGNLGPKLAATGGKSRIMTKASALAMRDHHMMGASWSEGLTGADMRTGLKAAKDRSKASAQDRSWAC
eukprot:TRINITY_DN30918_c0_g1_i1.p1 TRINITY_DN30918_c0_g1~~TRINITY_DN30918_c0_g1_i1.p1  ORF type:complete len:565 (+),score=113.81 TRINITY_DN30918_c0_g1_i1:91-1785(+)